MEISQKAINGETIVNAEWQFEEALGEIRLTSSERERLKFPFKSLVKLANKLNN